jgi:hypothetical protein
VSVPSVPKVRIVIASILIVVALIPPFALAQQPESELPLLVDGVAVVAPEMERPRGFLVSPDGQLFVALAGSGGPNRGSGLLPDSPLWGGLTGSVVVAEGGCETPLVTSLPSVTSAMERTWGVADLAVVEDQLYALVSGGGAAHGNRSDPNGIYLVGSDSTATLIADLSEWQRANPVAVPPPLDRVPDGMPFSMANIDGDLWVTERHHGQLLRVGMDGAISRIVDFSSTGLVPAGITPSPLGGAYVAIVGTPPYPADTSKIVSVTPDGAVSDAWTGLTAAVDVAVGLDGTLYALELGVPQSLLPPYLASHSGRVVRQIRPDASALVAKDLGFPSALEIGGEGAIYVSLSTIGLPNQLGTIIRIDPALESAVTIHSGPWPSPTCIEEDASTSAFST